MSKLVARYWMVPNRYGNGSVGVPICEVCGKLVNWEPRMVGDPRVCTDCLRRGAKEVAKEFGISLDQE